MSGFTAQVSSLERAASCTSAIGAQLARELTDLCRVAEDVLTGGWRGDAAAVFDRNWLAWQSAAGSVVAALDELGQQLSAAARDYAVRDAVCADHLARAAS